MSGEKKTILLDYNSIVELSDRELIENACDHFELVMPNEVMAIQSKNSVWLKDVTPLITGKKITLEDAGTSIELRDNEPGKKVCDIMEEYYRRNEQRFHYVMVQPKIAQRLQKWADILREKKWILVSPCELALLLYHEGKINKTELKRQQEKR